MGGLDLRIGISAFACSVVIVNWITSHIFAVHWNWYRPHYGTEFRIELIDATTEKPVGTGLITTQGMLQQQRDYLVEEKRVPFLSFVRPIRFEGTRRLMLELRAGFKSGFSTAEYYTSGKGIASGGDARPGKHPQYRHCKRFVPRTLALTNFNC